MELTSDPRFLDWPDSGWRRTESLLAYANNPRTHTQAQVDQIARSINEFGFTNPILIDDSGTIIAGHGRCEAARQLKIKQVPVIVLTGLTDDQLRAYVMTDNQLALDAGWDEGLLALELGALNDAGFDLSLIGFEDDILSKYIDEPVGLTDPDDVPEPPEVPITQLGDIWVLGQHRLMCGDATNMQDVDKLLGEARPLMMITDPPYGVEYKPKWRVDSPYTTNKEGTSTDYMEQDSRWDWSQIFDGFSGDIAYIWHASWFTPEIGIGIDNRGFTRRALIIWDKERPSFNRGHYQWSHEPCWYAIRNGKTAHWNGARNEGTVWKINRVIPKSEGKTGHAAQKPCEVMERPMRNHGGKSDAIYDPFMGSGTTLIAAERQSRQCFGIDIDPAFCDVAVRRWELFTGKTAVRIPANDDPDKTA